MGENRTDLLAVEFVHFDCIYELVWPDMATWVIKAVYAYIKTYYR